MTKKEENIANIKQANILIVAWFLLWTTTAQAQTIQASYYSEASLIREGTRKPGEKQITASGEVFKDGAMTCACRMFPLGSILRITYHGKSILVRVNDRIGKRFAKTRIDLSIGAFKALAPVRLGLITVNVERIK